MLTKGPCATAGCFVACELAAAGLGRVILMVGPVEPVEVCVIVLPPVFLFWGEAGFGVVRGAGRRGLDFQFVSMYR